MQARMSLQELAQKVIDTKKIKADYITPSNLMSMNDDGTLKLGLSGNNYGVGIIAHEQLSSKLGIPKPYYDRMLSNDIGLLADNVNVWLKKSEDRRMVRTVGGYARAILSDRYRPLDNDMILEAVMPTLMEHKGLEVLSTEITDRRLYLQVASKKLEGEVKTGEVVRQGITISNSEVGLGSIKVEPMLYILKCLNGAIMATAMRKYHLGKQIEADNYGYFSQDTINVDNVAFLMKIKDTVKGSFDELEFKQTLDKVSVTAKRKIETNFTTVIEDVTKRFDLNKSEGESILENLAKGGDFTQWGLSNAVTSLANTIHDYDRAIDLQRIGGRIIDLTDKEWNEVAND